MALITSGRVRARLDVALSGRELELVKTNFGARKIIRVNQILGGISSRRRDCHFDDTPCFIPIEPPTKGTGDQMTELSPTAQASRT